MEYEKQVNKFGNTKDHLSWIIIKTLFDEIIYCGYQMIIKARLVSEFFVESKRINKENL